jgi:iron complex outermembrane recepter protein
MLMSLLALASTTGTAAQPVPTPDAGPDIVVVTASPLSDPADALSQGVLVVTRADVLANSISGGIGEAISGQPGIRSTFYGANASRPIIRGLGEDRIRLLSNGLAGIDASTISPDHAPAIDGLDAERIEVLKGPAALRFGGNAVGGVVNVVDGRLPERMPDQALSGAFFLGTSSAENAKSGAVRLSATSGQMVLSLDGLARSSDDYEIAGFRQTEALRALTGDDVRGTAENTRGETWALGGNVARIGQKSNLALSVRKTQSSYGIPGEAAFIDLEQTRFDGRASFSDLGFVETLTFSASAGDYSHSEIEFSGDVGTVFANTGYEARIEARHKPFGSIEGLWGVQFGESDFSAAGEEAFIKPVSIKQAGLFGFERYDGGSWGAEIGARVETRDYEGLAGERSFDLTSFSGSVFFKPLAGLRLSLNAGRTERAPTEVELFADGPHAATAAFELGDANLKREIASSFEVGAHIEGGSWHGHIDLWQAEFDGFISFSPTGEIEDDLPLFIATQRDATLKGFEIAGAGTLWRGAMWSILTDIGYDFVEGRYRTGDTITRMPPSALTFSLEAKRDQFGVRAEVQALSAQNDVAEFETPTEAATIYNLQLNWQPLVSEKDFVVRLEGRNLTDEEVREHTSFLKDQLPKPGRSVRLSVTTRF